MLFDAAEPGTPEQISLQVWGPGHKRKQQMDETYIKRREDKRSRTGKSLG